MSNGSVGWLVEMFEQDSCRELPLQFSGRCPQLTPSQMLPVALDIHANGSVTGKIGDAELTKGRFSRIRGWLGRKLNLATDFIVKADLNGAIVAAEGISRAGVSIPLNFADGSFTGGLHTTGSKLGEKQRMILCASSLKLVTR